MEQAIDFLTKHKETRGRYDHNAIAEEFSLNPDTTLKTLKYFHIFAMMETNTRATEMTRPDPLVAGADWVVKGEESRFMPEDKKIIEQSKQMMGRSFERLPRLEEGGGGKGQKS